MNLQEKDRQPNKIFNASVAVYLAASVIVASDIQPGWENFILSNQINTNKHTNKHKNKQTNKQKLQIIHDRGMRVGPGDQGGRESEQGLEVGSDYPLLLGRHDYADSSLNE